MNITELRASTWIDQLATKLPDFIKLNNISLWISLVLKNSTKTIVAQMAEPNIKAVVKYWANLSEKPWLFLLGIIRDKIPENKKPIRGRKIVSLASMEIDKKLKKFLVKKNLFLLFYNRIYFWQIFIYIKFVDKKLKVTWYLFWFFCG